MPSRTLDYEVFDADNHLYETRDALTKFLPPARAGLIDYVDVSGRTKIAVRGRISEYIPNPTFERGGRARAPRRSTSGPATRRASPTARSSASRSTRSPRSASPGRGSS